MRYGKPGAVRVRMARVLNAMFPDYAFDAEHVRPNTPASIRYEFAASWSATAEHRTEPGVSIVVYSFDRMGTLLRLGMDKAKAGPGEYELSKR